MGSAGPRRGGGGERRAGGTMPINPLVRASVSRMSHSDRIRLDRQLRPLANPLFKPLKLHEIGMSLMFLNHGVAALHNFMKDSAARWIEESKSKLDCKVTLQQFFVRAKKERDDGMGNGLVRKVKVPTRGGASKTRVKLTDEASGVLTSWVHCITRELAARRTWDGSFNLTHFVIVDGTVHTLVKPKDRLARSEEIQNDGKRLAEYLRLHFTYQGMLPHYFDHLLELLEQIGRGGLENWRRLAIDSHCALMTEKARMCLVFLLKINWDGFNSLQEIEFMKAVKKSTAKISWFDDMEKIDVMLKVALYETDEKESKYESDSNKSAFRYIRNYCTHISGHCKDMGISFGDDFELLIPETFGNFLPEIMAYLLDSSLSKIIADLARTCMSCASLSTDLGSEPSEVIEARELPEPDLPSTRGNEIPANAVINFGTMDPLFGLSSPPMGTRLDGTSLMQPIPLSESRGSDDENQGSTVVSGSSRMEHLEKQLVKARAHVEALELELLAELISQG